MAAVCVSLHRDPGAAKAPTRPLSLPRSTGASKRSNFPVENGRRRLEESETPRVGARQRRDGGVCGQHLSLARLRSAAKRSCLSRAFLCSPSFSWERRRPGFRLPETLRSGSKRPVAARRGKSAGGTSGSGRRRPRGSRGDDDVERGDSLRMSGEERERADSRFLHAMRQTLSRPRKRCRESDFSRPEEERKGPRSNQGRA